MIEIRVGRVFIRYDPEARAQAVVIQPDGQTPIAMWRHDAQTLSDALQFILQELK